MTRRWLISVPIVLALCLVSGAFFKVMTAQAAVESVKVGMEVDSIDASLGKPVEGPHWGCSFMETGMRYYHRWPFRLRVDHCQTFSGGNVSPCRVTGTSVELALFPDQGWTP